MTEDKALLVRAVASVVLQRDVSLSRRVFTWFLGTADTSEEQVGYFQQHGEILATVLLDDMQADERDAYRIFLALLDKAEIGGVLAPKLVVPALRALRDADQEVSRVKQS